MSLATDQILIPDDKHGIRVLPTIHDLEIIDLYCEGCPMWRLEDMTGNKRPTVNRMLQRYGIPLRFWSPYQAIDHPMLLSVDGINAGGVPSLDAAQRAHDAAFARQMG